MHNQTDARPAPHLEGELHETCSTVSKTVGALRGMGCKSSSFRMMKDELELAAALRDALCVSDDLRRAPWRGAPDPVAGHCYVVSEAFHHLADGMGLQHWKPMQIRHEGVSHWFLKHGETGEIVDLTAEQFSSPVPYTEARGKGFLTRMPSKRCRVMVSRLNSSHVRDE